MNIAPKIYSGVYIIGALSLLDCHISVPRRESTGRQYSEKPRRNAVAVADPTPQSQSRGPEGPVVYG